MRLLPWLPVPLTLAVLGIWRPGLLLGGATSLRGLAVMVGVGLLGLVVLAALWRRSSAMALWTSSAVVLAVMAALLWPAFRERTVVESFPPVVDAAVEASATPAAPTPAAPTATPAPPAAPRATPAPAAAPAVTRAPTPAAASAVRLSTGRFHGINHRASGGVSLYRVAGRVVVRFESISFQGTPAPSVRLVAAGSRSPNGGIRLGGLKGERGSFSYPTPAGFDAAKGWTVLVWCDTYATPIAAADLH